MVEFHPVPTYVHGGNFQKKRASSSRNKSKSKRFYYTCPFTDANPADPCEKNASCKDGESCATFGAKAGPVNICEYTQACGKKVKYNDEEVDVTCTSFDRNPAYTGLYKECTTDDACKKQDEKKPICSNNNGQGFKMTFCVAEDTCNTDLAGGFGKITCPSKPAATGDAAAATGDGSIYLRIASASLILLGTLTQI